MNRYLDRATELKEKYIAYRRRFHMEPELGLEEFKTSETVKEHLESLGISYTIKAGTGVLGIIEGGKPGACIALRADMDALPITEENTVEYASKIPGKMHACGHDAHTAMLMGAAELLVENRVNLCGTVKLIFQPCEEGPSGARLMIADGCMENPHVNAAVALHVEATKTLTGKMWGNKGRALSGLYEFSLKVKGKGGHGAFPHLAVDPIVAAAQIITSLQSVVSRETDSSKSLVLSIGNINTDGRWNVIPESVEMQGTVRTFDREIYEEVMSRIDRVAAGICAAYRCTYELEATYSLPVMYNDEDLAELMAGSAGKIIGAENYEMKTTPGMGGEDFACYGDSAPACLFVLGASNPENGIFNPAHGPHFDLDENSIPIGMAVLAQTAEDYLTSH